MYILANLFWTIILFLCFAIARIKKPLSNGAIFWLNVSILLSFLDVVDKFVWHIYDFTLADLWYILGAYTLSLTYYLYVRGKEAV